MKYAMAWLIRFVNAWRALFWVIQIPLAFIFGWTHSLTYIVLLSQWALVESAWSTHRAKEAQREAKPRSDHER